MTTLAELTGRYVRQWMFRKGLRADGRLHKERQDAA